jgi:hypothetical protein
MRTSPENPAPNETPSGFSPQEELEITKKWYADTSFEGRTKADFEALRSEVRHSTTLDFARRLRDRDYRRLIFENPYVNDFLTESTVTDLLLLYDKKADFGLSEEQFRKLVGALGPEILQKWDEETESEKALTKAMQEALGQFSPDERKQHQHEITALMKNEIDLQEKGIQHKMRRPSLLPRKKQSS